MYDTQEVALIAKFSNLSDEELVDLYISTLILALEQSDRCLIFLINHDLETTVRNLVVGYNQYLIETFTTTVLENQVIAWVHRQEEFVQKTVAEIQSRQTHT